ALEWITGGAQPIEQLQPDAGLAAARVAGHQHRPRDLVTHALRPERGETGDLPVAPHAGALPTEHRPRRLAPALLEQQPLSVAGARQLEPGLEQPGSELVDGDAGAAERADPLPHQVVVGPPAPDRERH